MNAPKLNDMALAAIRNKSAVAFRQYFAPAVNSLGLLSRQFSTGEKTGMEDEYGKMDSSGETYKVSNFLLESGKVLKNVEVKYTSKA